MVLFDDGLIKEYVEWKNANPDNFSWWNYVNMKADLDMALAFAKFYSPEVIIIEDYFFLKDKFSKRLFELWKKECNNSKIDVEKMMNIYQLRDFFHINDQDTDNIDEKLKALGNVLKFFWEMSFSRRYQDKQVKVEVFKEDDEELFITVYEIS